MNEQELAKRFDYHPPRPDSDDAFRHEQVRETCRVAAECIVSLTEPGREQAVALTKLEEAMFWGNASIARNKE